MAKNKLKLAVTLSTADQLHQNYNYKLITLQS